MDKVYIERELESKIQKYLKRKEIIAIVGARQCGKTTLMKHLLKNLKNSKFISFDDQKILQIFEQDIDLFIKRYIDRIDFLFIDEFQYAKDGGKILKFIYDNYKTKIVLSGSSVIDLSVQSIKFLVGRILVFTLYPLSFEEFLKFKDRNLYDILKRDIKIRNITHNLIRKIYEGYVIFGGYPEVVLAKENEEKIEIIKNIYNTYLLKEIREILQINDDAKLAILIKALALQIGNEVNYNEVSLLTGFKYKELIEKLSILKKTFVCIESRPYFSNKRKELVKSPKFYFLDNGFRNISIDNFQELDKRTDKGPLNENFVASELFKKELKLNYWRTKSGAEVDFVVEKEGKLIPVEVKSIIKKPVYGKSLKSFIISYKPNKGYILSEDYYNVLTLVIVKIKFVAIFLASKLF